MLADWRHRFDRIVLLTAPDDLKIERYVSRTAPDTASREAAVADARMRLARQMPDREKSERADFVIENTGGLASLRGQVASVWEQLRAESRRGESHKALSNNPAISGSLE